MSKPTNYWEEHSVRPETLQNKEIQLQKEKQKKQFTEDQQQTPSLPPPPLVNSRPPVVVADDDHHIPPAVHPPPPLPPPPPPPVNNLHFDNMTTDAHLYPATFHGRSDEDAEAFIKSFDRWRTFKQLDDAPVLAALPLMLKDGALRWFDTQTNAIQTTMADLRNAFRALYYSNNRQRWQKAAKLWTLKPKADQTVDDFITEVDDDDDDI